MYTKTLLIKGQSAPLHVWPASCDTCVPIHFAHANGFPAGTYEQFLNPLSAQRTVYALDHRGTWDDSPEIPHKQFNWHHAADDMLVAIEQCTPQGVVGIGHSLGATMMLLAAAKRPKLFKKIILIEPIVFPTRMFLPLACLPMAIRSKLIPLAQRTLKRREHWSSCEEFMATLSTKSLFKDIPTDVMLDYARHGLRTCPPYTDHSGQELKLSLRFRKEWEAQVFMTAPYVWHALKRLAVPCAVWRGETSHILPDVSWQKWSTMRPDIPVHILSGLGHLAPLQSPKRMAEEIQEHLISI